MMVPARWPDRVLWAWSYCGSCRICSVYCVQSVVVDDVVTVSDEVIIVATRVLFSKAHLCAGTDAAVGIAAVPDDKEPK